MKTLAELYAQPEILAEARRFRALARNLERAPFQDTLRRLSSFATTEALQGHLNALSDRPSIEASATLLGALPPRELTDNFGVPPALWAMVNAHGVMADRVASGLGAHGYDVDLLKRARTTLVIDGSEAAIPLHKIAQQYGVMEHIVGGGLQDIVRNWQGTRQEESWPALLKAHTKRGAHTGKPSTLRKTHQLTPVRHSRQDALVAQAEWPHTEEIKERYLEPDEAQLWLSAPVGFTWDFKGVPQAIVSVMAANNALRVEQLQGIQHEAGVPECLGRFQWRELLLSVTEQLARSLGMKAIGLAGSRRVLNDAFCFGDRQLVKQSYDGTAERLNFTPDEEGDWYKSVS